MTQSKLSEQIETPCIGICSTIYGDDICRGCKRFSDEVIEWNTLPSEQKRQTLARLAQLTENIMREYCEQIDAEQVKLKCEKFNIRVRDNESPYCWAYALLREGNTHITDISKFGITLKKHYQGVRLSELFAQLDEDLYQLSESYWLKR